MSFEIFTQRASCNVLFSAVDNSQASKLVGLNFNKAWHWYILYGYSEHVCLLE